MMYLNDKTLTMPTDNDVDITIRSSDRNFPINTYLLTYLLTYCWWCL